VRSLRRYLDSCRRRFLRRHVAAVIGRIARPAALVVVQDVHKTRSGKILRRLLSELCEGSALAGTTSLQNEECLPGITAGFAQR
jgi:acetyl-CoA synthetase